MSDTLLTRECRWCGGTGNVPDKDPSAKAIKKIIEMAMIISRVQKMTDLELANVILADIWPDSNLMDGTAAIISSVIDRLRRAKGGPMPDMPEPEDN